jgi:phosphoribosylformimino-5-aminoimidazole carboxamide ribotide isomerase
MIAIPAIDLRDGACVQLVGGSYDDERIRLNDPIEVARRWTSAGFGTLHVVDLDAATGVGNNDALITSLIRESGAMVQVGGGIRSTERAAELLDLGAARVIVGTRAVEDRDWLEALAASNPERIVVAADVRERRILTHGWARAQAREVVEFITSIATLPLAGLLVTAVHREGRLGGTDLPLMEEATRASALPIVASGGIASLDDLASLESRGVAAAVIGMALYTGAVDPSAAAAAFNS